MIMMPLPHTTSLLLLFLLQRGSAVSVTTSPSSDSLPDANRTFLLANSRHPYPTPINLAPLTNGLQSLNPGDFRTFHCEGSLVVTSSSNTASITPKDIALISCDPSAYQGYINASETLSSLIALTTGGPAAVVLYSSQDDHCEYQVLDRNIDYFNVFTILNSTVATTVVSQLQADSTNTSNTIAANMATTGSVGFGNSSDSGDAGPSGLAVSTPTTAVAMIILYTITGIITALFLGIIITGAVRAHRHPERYGPRNVVGRPRQSRARGIARAMLETIPIVKFGDSDTNQVAAAKRDVEMASRSDDGATAEPTTAPTTAPTHHDSDSDRAAPEVQSETPATIEENHETVPAAATDGGNRVCPICTDEFVKGQDMRVLPCNHQFHPECIDPWLINVSGTCPLCRIDLNPADESAEQTEQGEQQTDAEHTAAEPAVEESTTATPASHRRLTGYLSDIRHARNAPVEERIAALRQLRQNEQQQGATNTSEDATDEAQGRRRLTMRLRDRFRIRTRRQE